MMRGESIAVFVAALGWSVVSVVGGEPVRVCLWAAEVPVARIPEWQGTGEGGWFAAARADVAAGRSEEAAMLLVSGRQGERMTIESVREVIYPTEEDPESSRFADPVSWEELMAFRVTPPFLPPVPPAFETRNVGETIEVEVGGSGGTRSLRLDAEWVRQDGEDVIQQYGQDDGGTWKISFPRFVTRKIRSSVDCAPGRWTLAGMVDPWREAAKPGTKVLLFVRVETMQRAK